MDTVLRELRYPTLVFAEALLVIAVVWVVIGLLRLRRMAARRAVVLSVAEATLAASLAAIYAFTIIPTRIPLPGRQADRDDREPDPDRAHPRRLRVNRERHHGIQRCRQRPAVRAARGSARLALPAQPEPCGRDRVCPKRRHRGVPGPRRSRPQCRHRRCAAQQRRRADRRSAHSVAAVPQRRAADRIRRRPLLVRRLLRTPVAAYR